MIPIVKLLPIRDETGKIYKWQEQQEDLSPLQVTRVRLEPAVEKVVVRLVNGEEYVIEDNLLTFRQKFIEATE